MELEESFDLIVVGTGLTESIVAAAASRIGKTVLHLDCNDYYGGEWTSFSFSQINEWVERQRVGTVRTSVPQTSDAAEDLVNCCDQVPTVVNVKMIDYSLKEDDSNTLQEDAVCWTFRKLVQNDRKFSIDLCPRLLYSRGSMVDTLVQSNISRYLEFKALTRILSRSPINNDLMDVPCSRCDIFTSKTISVIEKRMLMKFMSECMEKTQLLEELEEYKEKPFVEFLNAKGLSEVLQHFIVNAIAMCNRSETTEKAMANMNQFLSSLGRFGNTPFIFPLYGSGELPQAFCRLCAVFGGTYCLKRSLDAIVLNSNSGKVTHVITEGQKIKCNFLVTSLSQTPRCFLPQNLSQTVLSKAIFISNGSIKPSNKEETTFLRLNADEEIMLPVNVLEVGSNVHVCPPNIFIVYCWCESQSEDAKKDLLPVAKKLFNFTSENNDKPKLLWSCYYNQILPEMVSPCFSMKENSIFVVSPPPNELDYDLAIAEARNIYSTMFPDLEFLPRAPDPDEIILDEPQLDSSENNV